MEISAYWEIAFADQDRRPIWEWCADNITLPSALAESGKFDPERSPQFKTVMRWLQDDAVRRVYVQAPPRGGKTLILDLWCPWVLANDPGPMMCVFKEPGLMKEHAEARTWPILDSCELIRGMTPSDPDALRANERVYGHMGIYFKPAIASHAQSKGVRYLALDEAWQYNPGVMGQFEARVGDFERIGLEKIFYLSQGGEETGEWAESTRTAEFNELHVRCLNCMEQFAPLWVGERGDGSYWGMKWDECKDSDGFWLTEQAAETARFECPHCKFEHPDLHSTRNRWKKAYEFKVIGEKKATRKLAHWTAIIDTSWRTLVNEWLIACNASKRGIMEPKLDFWQKRMAQHRSLSSLESDEVTFHRENYSVSVKEEPGFMRCMTVDKQAEGMYWVLIGDWEIETGKFRRARYARVYGEGALDELQQEYGVRPKRVFVDAGFESKGDSGVFAMCGRRGWIACRGTDDDYFVWHYQQGKEMRKERRPYAMPETHDPGIGTKAQGMGIKCTMYRFSSPVVSEAIHQMLRDGNIIDPVVDHKDEIEKAFKRQMGGEAKRLVIDKRGQTRAEWFKRWENHAFDTMKMQILAAMAAPEKVKLGYDFMAPTQIAKMVDKTNDQ